jgi:hypothetical protein
VFSFIIGISVLFDGYRLTAIAAGRVVVSGGKILFMA